MMFESRKGTYLAPGPFEKILAHGLRLFSRIFLVNHNIVPNGSILDVGVKQHIT